MWHLARTPRWIGILVVCLAIAAAFALLGQWQLSRSVEGGTTIDRDSETSVPLESIAEPQQAVTTIAAGQRVTVEATLLDEFVVLSGRLNDGESGHWVVGHAIDAGGASIAVALGWAPTADAAADAVEGIEPGERTFTGRFVTSEGPEEDDFENGEQNSLSVAALINQWPTVPNGVYGGYIVWDDAAAGLDVIDSPVPEVGLTLNWLNVFYAVEWAVFAVFAVYLWFRLVKDAWEREQEDEEPELN